MSTVWRYWRYLSYFAVAEAQRRIWPLKPYSTSSPLLISSFTGTYELALPQAGAFGLKGNPTLPRQLAYLHNTRDFYYLLDSGSE